MMEKLRRVDTLYCLIVLFFVAQLVLPDIRVMFYDPRFSFLGFLVIDCDGKVVTCAANKRAHLMFMFL